MYNLYMKLPLILLACLFFALPNIYAKTVKQRVGKLEKRMTKNEMRISNLERYSKSAGGKKTSALNAKAPIIVYYISSINKAVGNKMGAVVTIVLENSNSKPTYAFSGDLIFRTKDGKVFFKQPYIQSEPLFGHKRKRILLLVNSAKYPRAYLRFMRDKKIKVSLINQKIY